jgi:hypothetical protein
MVIADYCYESEKRNALFQILQNYDLYESYMFFKDVVPLRISGSFDNWRYRFCELKITHDLRVGMLKTVKYRCMV